MQHDRPTGMYLLVERMHMVVQMLLFKHMGVAKKELWRKVCVATVFRLRN